MTKASLSSLRFDVSSPSDWELAQLTFKLEPEQRDVLLDHETEAPFCGVQPDEGQEGIFTCRLCGLPLFMGSRKYDSGTGWPSFTLPFANDHLRYTSETNFRMV